jgi:hypothetical protein
MEVFNCLLNCLVAGVGFEPTRCPGYEPGDLPNWSTPRRLVTCTSYHRSFACQVMFAVPNIRGSHVFSFNCFVELPAVRIVNPHRHDQPDSPERGPEVQPCKKFHCLQFRLHRQSGHQHPQCRPQLHDPLPQHCLRTMVLTRLASFVIISLSVSVHGIGPSYLHYERSVLPLNYTDLTNLCPCHPWSFP